MTRPLVKLEAVEPLSARPAIRIRDLHKRVGELTAIDGMSLDIAHGELFMIGGPNGCGKTTPLRILAGLDSVTSGTIEIETPNSHRPVNSMIFQGDSIFPWMTVWDNAAYGLKMRRMPRSVIKDVVGHYLARTGLTRFADACLRLGDARAASSPISASRCIGTGPRTRRRGCSSSAKGRER